MTQPINNNDKFNDIGCLVVLNDKLPSSSIVINEDNLNKETTIGNEIINVPQTLILPQPTIQNKIIPVTKSVNFLQLPKTNRKQFKFL
jgi:hypothetical protein